MICVQVPVECNRVQEAPHLPTEVKSGQEEDIPVLLWQEIRTLYHDYLPAAKTMLHYHRYGSNAQNNEHSIMPNLLQHYALLENIPSNLFFLCGCFRCSADLLD